MAKPWAKYEIGYIDHDKFLALNSNAICLWHEGKNYCDANHTDGLIPHATAKRFRFFSKKAVEMLQTSAGPKPGTALTYAPLWEAVAGFGFKMHDYLDHNDCRETVLTRMAQAEGERERKRENQRIWRERQKTDRRQAQADGALPVTDPVTEAVTDPVTREERSALLPDKQKQQQKQNTEPEEEPKKSGGVSARSKRPIYQSDRFAVFEWQLDEISQTLGPHLDAFDLHGFFDALTQQSRESGLVIPSDREARWKWIQAQIEAEARRRGLPMADAASAAAPTNKRIAGLAAGTQAFLNRRQA